MKYDGVSKSGDKLLRVWMSKELLPHLDRGVKKEDSDRSKFVRNAIREKLSRHSPPVELGMER